MCQVHAHCYLDLLPRFAIRRGTRLSVAAAATATAEADTKSSQQKIIRLLHDPEPGGSSTAVLLETTTVGWIPASTGQTETKPPALDPSGVLVSPRVRDRPAWPS